MGGRCSRLEFHESNDESSEAVERLLAAERPRAAFASIRHKTDVIPSTLLHKLLTKMAEGGRDKEGTYQLEHYHVEQAFSRLDKSNEVTVEEKARLEFAYIDALSHPGGRREGYGIPNLEKYTEANPSLFTQAIVWMYRRKDGGEDPPEWKTPQRTSNTSRGAATNSLKRLTAFLVTMISASCRPSASLSG